MNDNARTRFYLDKNGFFAGSAVILLILTAIFRMIGCWGFWEDKVSAVMLVVLPVCCCLLMILCILLLGRKLFFLSFIPVLLGMVFFVFMALSATDWVWTVLRVLLYLSIAVVYMGTVFGWIHTKWVLPPVFGLLFLYHIIMIDLPALNNAAEPVSFTDGVQEMSILCVIAAMFFIGLGLKKRQLADRPKFGKKTKKPAKPEPAAPAVQPEAPAEPAPTQTSAPDMDAILSDEVHSTGLTLDPEPWEPAAAAEKPAESDHD